MKRLLDKIHARLGDFWWYTLMIFIAARAADCLNVFVGLWLVPKYVPPSELGAVQPLASLASFFAIPIAVFASTFQQELSNLALTKQFGKMKTLMRSVFIAAGVFLFASILVSRFVLPHFLLRIRVAEGSLGFIILLSSFVAAISPIFQNALRALKKFKATVVINIVGAPVRLLVMLITMPLRALSGYFIGQASPPAFSVITSVIALRKELSVPAEPYWTKEVVSRFARLFCIFGINALVGGLLPIAETLIIRQRLPEVESAAYYMMTRFAEIAAFLQTPLVFTLFPFTAELAAKGRNTLPLVLKASAAIIVTNAALALVFHLLGTPIISSLPHGSEYAGYSWITLGLIANATMLAIMALYTTAEISANRFGYMMILIPCNLLYVGALFLVTGHGYAEGLLPDAFVQFLARHNITSIETMLYWMNGATLVRLIFCFIHAVSTRRHRNAVK